MMYRRFDDGNSQVLAYRLSGKVTDDEVEEIKRELSQVVDTRGKARLLVELGDLAAPEPSAVWEDLKATPTYVKDVERFAIVGDRRWHEWAAALSDKLTAADSEFFESARLDEAWDWIRS